MKDFIDFEGKSVEQAIEKACHELNVSKDRLAYDIISYGSTGIFGLVRTKKALIRVSAPNSKSRSKETPQANNAESGEEHAEPAVDASENREGDNRSAINALLDETFGEMAPVEEKDVSEGRAEETIAEPVEEPDQDHDQDQGQEQEQYPEKDQAPYPAQDEAQAADEADDDGDQVQDPDQIEADSAAPASDEAIAVATEMLSRILAVLSPGAEVSVHQDPDLCRIHINGGETAVLIGRKGQTLEAMQYLVDKAINKQCGKGYRIVVDVEGYLETRRNELQDTAARMAEKAQKSGKPTTMNRMNAHDRRIVHLALKNNKAVRTQSVGDGYYRKLMILPKRRKRGSKSGNRSRQSQ